MFSYRTNCTLAKEKELSLMIENSSEISYEKFLKLVDEESFNELAKSLGYDKDFPIQKEPYISYHKSTFRGKDCVYLVQSAIEHIFY